MFCQTSFDLWLTTIKTHLPPLSKTQATMLALWSFGMVLARSYALSAVSGLLPVKASTPAKDFSCVLRFL